VTLAAGTRLGNYDPPSLAKASFGAAWGPPWLAKASFGAAWGPPWLAKASFGAASDRRGGISC